jgi:hypothetical protein
MAVREKREDAESEMHLVCAPPFHVMAGLVPAIHAAPLQTTFEVGNGFWAWMLGTRPGMTCWGSERRSAVIEFYCPDGPAGDGK